jgi:chorismate mutase/prephenate dehydrogenase
MAWVLGLSHALNIAFFSALARSGLPADELAAVSSTTFERQLALARQVASENPHLYYEIQRLNPGGREGLRALQGALAELIDQVEDDREDAFVATMRRGAEYLRGLDAEGRT